LAPWTWRLAQVATLLTACATLAYQLVHSYALPYLDDCSDDAAFAWRIARSTMPAMPPRVGEWIERATVEQRIKKHVESRDPKILIMVGPNASGKSTSVQHALRDTRGIVRVDLKGSDEILSNVLVKFGMPAKPVNLGRMQRLCASAAWWFRMTSGDPRSRPTIVVELNSTMEAGSIKDAVQALKTLSYDYGLCTGVIVMSDAHATFAFTVDPARHDIIWTDDFTREEAAAYFESRNILMGEHALRKTIFDLTTRPGHLGDAVRSLECGPTEQREQVSRIGAEMIRKAETRCAELLALSDSADKHAPGEPGLHFRKLFEDLLANGSVAGTVAAEYMGLAKTISPILIARCRLRRHEGRVPLQHPSRRSSSRSAASSKSRGSSRLNYPAAERPDQDGAGARRSCIIPSRPSSKFLQKSKAPACLCSWTSFLQLPLGWAQSLSA
jgi:hypothetical protein